MKLLSIVVPCYNSQEYMSKCIESLLIGGEAVEIIVVNDGSVDDTIKIGREYENKYPTIVKCVDQPNKGHGGAVNTGVKNATGKYFKVVDSDDYLEKNAYMKVLEVLKKHHEEGIEVDVYISNFVYDKVGVANKKVMSYKNSLKPDVLLTWDDVSRLKLGQYILMHSVIYRTEILLKTGLELPEHTFYVDNIYVYIPMQYVETLYYIDVDLYKYFIGRDDQSVNEPIMIKRIDQQIKVNKFMLDNVDYSTIKHKKQRNYMLKYFEIVTAISLIFLIRSGTQENMEKKKELWEYIKKDKYMYSRMKNRVLMKMLSSDKNTALKASSKGYDIARERFGFN